MSRLVIVGGSGHARVVADAARRQGRAKLIGFISLDQPAGTVVDGTSVLGTDALLDAMLADDPDLACHIGIGSNAIRSRIAADLAARHPGVQFDSVVHPGCVLAETVGMGAGCFVAASATVNPGTWLGDHVIINTAASIDHECQIGALASVGPGAILAGNVVIKDRAFVGAGAVILPGVHVGAGAAVGAGAVVTRPVAAGITVVGNPARAVSSPIESP